MDPVSFLPALVALIIALLSTKLVSYLFKFTPEPVKHLSIDGLRGYLAFFVFLHHSAIWYFYLRTSVWTLPPSHLYTHFGHSGVALFFMITGFLFFSKLIDAREKPIDWIKLYVARIMRLLPLYLIAVFSLILIVLACSHFMLREPLSIFLKKTFIWSSFTILGNPAINGVENTRYIVASVTWSLVYEWLFYFSLPLFGLMLFKIRSSILIFTISVLAMAGIIYFNYFTFINLSAFGGGIAAAFLIRRQKFADFAKTPIASGLLLLCIITAVVFFQSTYAVIPMILISIGFILIACGNDLFGALTSTVSRTLGQMAYSIYLLHGILLFVTFNFILSWGNAARFSVFQHWVTIACCVPVLIGICFVAHIYIELPFMNASKKASKGFKKMMRSKR